MSLNIIVLAKQVPDTRNVGKDAMKEDGTINRAALPAIFNPEDLNALEQALRIKRSQPPGTTVTILTMGLPRAAEVIREAIFRGADSGIVLTDRVLGGADTLATSYSLAPGREEVWQLRLILGGRQAIRRRHCSGWSADSRKTRNSPGDICRGNRRSGQWPHHSEASSRTRCGNRKGSAALRGYCQRFGC